MTKTNSSEDPGRPKFVVGALGDSITTAFNAAVRQDNLAYSWATGHADDDMVVSHYQRLRKVFPEYEFELHNAAFSGARASSLASQVGRLVAFRPDYVTLLIGANDIYRWLMGDYAALLAQFVTDVRAAIERLIAASPHVKILSVGIPNQARLLDLILAQDLARVLPFMADLSPTWLEMLRMAYRERWQRANDALAELARAFPDNVRFNTLVPETTFAREHLSPIDSYHPSLAGQRLLADVTWRDGWYSS